MKNKLIISLCVLSALVGTVYAANAEPGTSDDPIVTRSYVESKIDDVNEKIEELKKLLQDGSEEDKEESTEVEKPIAPVASMSYKVIEVESGETLIGNAGTELIIRGGHGTALSITVNGIENGLQNITEGRDILGGETVPLNHLVVVPREDGRGVSFKEHSYVMIRGGYQIK